MIVDLFLRTYSKDVKWLPFLFRSLIRHARGFNKLVVVTPIEANVSPVVDGYRYRLIDAGAVTAVALEECDTNLDDDYNGQQVTKLEAYRYSSADEALYLDSDLVFIRDVDPTTRHGLIEARPWADAGQAIIWRGITEQLLMCETYYETMCRHPFQYPVQLVRRCFDHIGGLHAVAALPPGQHISEFNLIGNYATLIEHRLVTWVRDPAWKPDVVKAFWSHGGITDAVAEELKQLGYWEDV